jgi:hypothetical protein
LHLLQLSEEIREIVASVATHRKELARVLQKAGRSYVLLFERMVSELTSLSVCRKKGLFLHDCTLAER